jgi:hypothetical protein
VQGFVMPGIRRDPMSSYRHFNRLVEAYLSNPKNREKHLLFIAINSFRFAAQSTGLLDTRYPNSGGLGAQIDRLYQVLADKISVNDRASLTLKLIGHSNGIRALIDFASKNPAGLSLNEHFYFVAPHAATMVPLSKLVTPEVNSFAEKIVECVKGVCALALRKSALLELTFVGTKKLPAWLGQNPKLYTDLGDEEGKLFKVSVGKGECAS